MNRATLLVGLTCIAMMTSCHTGHPNRSEVPCDSVRNVTGITSANLLDAGAENLIEIEIMVVGAPDGGAVIHGDLAFAEIRIKNVSDSSLSVPFSPRPLGKAYAKEGDPSYVKPGEDWFFAGARIPRLAFRFEDAQGRPIVETPVMFDDIPSLSPGGHVTRHCIFRSPPQPGKYHLRLFVDTRPLAGDTGHNDMDPHKEARTAFVRKDIVLKNLTVR